MPPSVVSRTYSSEQARDAARARWGPPRVVRLDSLTAEERAVVLALIAAKKAAQEAPDGTS